MKRKVTAGQITLGAMFSALTAIGAYISIPITSEVPFTLQVLFVLLAGTLLGPVTGFLSQITYLALGLVFPVYAGGRAGLGYLFGPRGGYLWGFVTASVIAGVFSVFARRLTGWKRTAVNFVGIILGLVSIYAGGAASLKIIAGYSWNQAVGIGIIPFIPFDLVKAVIAALLAGRLQDVFK